MRQCGNGHESPDSDLFCAVCGGPTEAVAASAAPAFSCVNGHAAGRSDKFCGICGGDIAEGVRGTGQTSAPLGSPTLSSTSLRPPISPRASEPTIVVPVVAASQTPGVQPAPVATAGVGGQSSGQGVEARRSLTPLIVAGTVVAMALIAGIVVVAVAANSSNSSSKTQASATVTTTSPSTSTSTSTTSTTTFDPSRAPVTQLDAILVQSSADRGSLSVALNGVRNCSMGPGQAAAQIQSIVSGRQSEMTQVNGLDAGSSAEVGSLKSQLLEALSNSLQSDTVYYQVVSSMGACGPITDSAMASASATDTAATAAKRAFIAAYNPVAAQYGLRADWVEAQI